MVIEYYAENLKRRFNFGPLDKQRSRKKCTLEFMLWNVKLGYEFGLYDLVWYGLTVFFWIY
jgi:hypothetical protein